METTQQQAAQVWWQLGLDALRLSACALHGRKAEPDTRKNLAQLFSFCKFHTVTSLVAMALEQVWRDAPGEVPEQAHLWRQAKDQAIRKNILLDAERQAIVSHLESVGCWHMPLKGSILQYDYPVFGMRQMSDNDILVDPTRRDEIRDYMVSRGYEVLYFRQGGVDSYLKAPVYNIEIHSTLFSRKESQTLERYYRDIWQRAEKDEKGQWRYHLTDEDFYIYMVAHGHKHMVRGGIGIRYLLDVQVFLEKHGKALNWDYVTGELKKLQVEEFEAQCRSVCKKLLGETMDVSALTRQEKEMLQAFFVSGTFGTEEQEFHNKLRSSDGKVTVWTKLKYMGKRLVPDMDLLQVDYPDIYEKKWKVPFILIWRVFRSIFIHPVKTMKELLRVGKARDGD